MILSSKKIDKKNELINFEKVYHIALLMLGRQMLTKQKIREKLQHKQIDGQLIDQVINKLLSERLIDDALFAETVIETFKRYKLVGYYGILFKLRQKGVDKVLGERVLRTSFSLNDELIIARKFYNKITGSKKLTYEEKQKALQKCIRKGFRSAVISRL